MSILDSLTIGSFGFGPVGSLFRSLESVKVEDIDLRTVSVFLTSFWKPNPSSKFSTFRWQSQGIGTILFGGCDSRSFVGGNEYRHLRHLVLKSFSWCLYQTSTRHYRHRSRLLWASWPLLSLSTTDLVDLVFKSFKREFCENVQIFNNFYGFPRNKYT